MKNLYTFLVALLISSSISAQIIDIPDSGFKYALVNTNCVAEHGWASGTSDADTNDDGEISIEEAEAILHLNTTNVITIFDMSGIEYFTNLESLNCSGSLITSLNVSNLVNLERLVCSNAQLTSLEIGGLSNLSTLECAGNNLTSLELNTPSLYALFCDNNELTTLDLSNTRVTDLFAFNNRLTYVNIKNGVNHFPPDSHIDLGSNPDLEVICADPREVDGSSGKPGYCCTLPEMFGGTSVILTTYCSFVPGGTYYTVEGTTHLDFDDDGCTIDDPVYSHLNFSITNGSVTGGFIANSSGEYLIPVQDGTHTITPILENPDYYTVTPPEITVSFPTDASPFIQDFCITPNGNFNDLEIAIIPRGAARPGFDTDYKVIYKNKGNTTLSGNIHFGFEDDVMEFITSTPPNESGVSDLLQWSFIDLAPFESRVIDLTMNLNAPTDTPPLNDGDILTLNTSITSSETDETPEDNVFELNQTVVNSFDPNDKTCLEGEYITPEMVGEYVHYMIRFENTGSAEAVNIVVKDHIDISKYDLSSLVPLHASHDYFARIKDSAPDHYVEFIFENINLPFDDANNDGYIVFKIKTLDTLALDDTFENEAEIYFDFNFPIITNIAQTTVGTLSVEDIEFDANISIYPNPVQNELHINSKEAIEAISIYDISGRLIREKSMIGNQLKTSISTEKLSSSVYFITVKTTQNEFTKRIVKD